MRFNSSACNAVSLENQQDSTVQLHKAGRITRPWYESVSGSGTHEELLHLYAVKTTGQACFVKLEATQRYLFLLTIRIHKITRGY